MALIKHRPKLGLLIPRALVPGGRSEARVVVTARREVPVDVMRAELSGEERATIGSGQYASTRKASLLRLGAQLCGAAVLPAGRSEHAFTFELPEALPPSIDLGRASVRYTMTVRASIPWWPDAKAAFEVNVAPRPFGAAPPARPALFSSRPGGPEGREPHVEGSLASSTVEVGGDVRGSIALGNRDYNVYRDVVLALIGERRIKLGSRCETAEVHRYQVVLPGSRWSSVNDSVDYSFRVPPEAPPSMSSSLLALVWRLEILARVRWRGDVRLSVPLVVLPPAAPTREKLERSYHAPPVVGSERIARIWSTVAEERGLRYSDAGRVEGKLGEVAIEVWREHRGRGGVFVVGELHYPDLGLDLEVEPVGRVRGLVDGGVAFAGEAFDRRHRVVAREPDQAAAFGRTLSVVPVSLALENNVLVPRLWAKGHAHKTVSLRIDDERARLEIRDGGQSPATLRGLIGGLVVLAGAVSQARLVIPAPAAMAAAEPGWRALAVRLGGTLQRGRMAVLDGKLGAGIAVRVVTEWDGVRPDGTLLAAQVEGGVPKEYRLSLHHGAGGEPPDETALNAACARLPAGPARQLLGRLAGVAASLELGAEELRLRLAGPLEDPASAVGLLGEMAQLCHQLRPGRGPFR